MTHDVSWPVANVRRLQRHALLPPAPSGTDPADLPMWMAALSAIPAHSPFPNGVRLTPKQAEQIVDAIGHALEDSELTIDELDRAVVNLAGDWAGDRVMPAFQDLQDLWPRWRQAVGMAAYRGVLCFGPNKGRRVDLHESAPLAPRIQAGLRRPGHRSGDHALFVRLRSSDAAALCPMDRCPGCLGG
jgi:hypothetical protein